MEDKRFSHILTDPKFRKIPKRERKVKIDNRFQSMFKDKKFKVKYTVDKRGRPVNHTSSEDLKRYYELSSGEESSKSDAESEDDNYNSRDLKSHDNNEKNRDSKSEDDDNKDSKSVNKNNQDFKPDDNEENDSGSYVKALKDCEDELLKTDSTDKKVTDNVKKKLKNLSVDYARGEASLFSDSSSDDEESESEESEEGNFLVVSRV